MTEGLYITEVGLRQMYTKRWGEWEHVKAIVDKVQGAILVWWKIALDFYSTPSEAP